MTAIFAPIRMIEDQLAALVARNGIFAGDPGAPTLSAATRGNGVPSLMSDNLGHLERDVTPVAHDRRSDLDELLPQAGQ